ncbi:MAG: choline-sulfatase, partial [Gammaproteobacteria bacterium]|nr:choline-sulfatase [Gammaproteobacteria bacterium]
MINNLRRQIILIVVTFLSLVPGSSAETNTEKPDILFIMVDDLNDWVGPLEGHPQVRTPNIDKLAT